MRHWQYAVASVRVGNLSRLVIKDHYNHCEDCIQHGNGCSQFYERNQWESSKKHVPCFCCSIYMYDHVCRLACMYWPYHIQLSHALLVTPGPSGGKALQSLPVFQGLGGRMHRICWETIRPFWACLHEAGARWRPGKPVGMPSITFISESPWSNPGSTWLYVQSSPFVNAIQS